MKHTIHQLAQGSPQWHAFRAQHFTASEAPAMLGISAYQSRSDLLKAKATGYTPEIDAATQRRFNAGHDAEAGARQIAEQEIGQDLYPITASRIVDGLALSASYDGATMGEDIIWEHKLANVGLLESLSRGVIPEQYHPQIEQQLLVIGAEKALFMASSGDKTAMECVWYTSNPELRARIIAGWKQFAIDLAAYVPPEVIVPAVAAPQKGLPAVSITVNGSIALVDNLDKFGAALTTYVERINKKPETDQDFADLEATVKTLKTAEEALDAAEANALAQTDSIDAMRRTVALYRETARTNRLLIEKLVKAEKENRRTAIVSDAAAELVIHVRKLNERLGVAYMPNTTADFQGVIKGLKSLDSMKDKVATELARCKIEANAMADRIQANLETKGLNGYAFLFADLATICTKAPEDFQNTVTARITAHEAAQAAKVERIVTAPDIAPVTHEVVTQVMMPATVRQAMAPRPDTAPTLALGTISERLGFNCTSAFLATLGYEATVVKAARLFHEADFLAICEAIKTHISEVQDQFEAEEV